MARLGRLEEAVAIACGFAVASRDFQAFPLSRSKFGLVVVPKFTASGGSIWVDGLARFRASDVLPGLFVVPEMSDDSLICARVLFAINLRKVRQVEVDMGNPSCKAIIFEDDRPGLAFVAMSVHGLAAMAAGIGLRVFPMAS